MKNNTPQYLKWDEHLVVYKEEGDKYPSIRFKYCKGKLAKFVDDYPNYDIWWVDKLPTHKKMKKEIMEKWNRRIEKLKKEHMPLLF